jgi:hypothetical protein
LQKTESTLSVSRLHPIIGSARWFVTYYVTNFLWRAKRGAYLSGDNRFAVVDVLHPATPKEISGY